MKMFRRFLLIAGVVAVGAAALVAQPTPAMADNDQIGILSLATRTASANSATLVNERHRGVVLHVDVDSVVGGGSVDCAVQTLDPTSATWVAISGASTGAKTAGTYELVVYPGVTETANLDVSRPLPKKWRVVATVVTSATFSVAGSYVD